MSFSYIVLVPILIYSDCNILTNSQAGDDCLGVFM